jgi:hypothetical protein
MVQLIFNFVGNHQRALLALAIPASHIAWAGLKAAGRGVVVAYVWLGNNGGLEGFGRTLRFGCLRTATVLQPAAIAPANQSAAAPGAMADKQSIK